MAQIRSGRRSRFYLHLLNSHFINRKADLTKFLLALLCLNFGAFQKLSHFPRKILAAGISGAVIKREFYLTRPVFSNS